MLCFVNTYYWTPSVKLEFDKEPVSSTQHKLMGVVFVVVITQHCHSYLVGTKVNESSCSQTIFALL